ncbi:MAG: glutamate 5-kinase [Proteobacteria bacterium]|nr:glutamate 5-kinase [Cystobacterineae bacterium]MCL2259102.1 glutamate 5-kinase [Cystobacterineae bacterium]MCL2314506.1 glutamate 5-kinase [Pseudomonadota bacterium]
MLKEVFQRAKKIVLKIGSNTLTGEDGFVSRDYLNGIASQVAEGIQRGQRILIVSSGARVSGLSAINKWARSSDIHYKQALCAIGQVELMDSWRRAFAQHATYVGQILLTKDDFSDAYRALNIRNTLFTLMDEGVVPIVNENDTTCVEEIKIGDNDNLAALTAILWGADLLVLLSDVEGVFDKNPKQHADAKLIETVRDFGELEATIQTFGLSSFGTGGIQTKIEAAKKVVGYGIPMILTNGKTPAILKTLATGNTRATLFLPS